MAGMLGELALRLRLKWLGRHQFDSLVLRNLYRERFRIDVGLYSYGCFDRWRMPGPIVVGRYCSIANSVRSAPINHPFDAMTTNPVLYEAKFGVVDRDIHYDAPLVIQDDVWIAHNVMILPACKFIGRGAIIGAGSVVTRDVPPYAVVAGNPAKKLRDRFTAELAAALDASRWWEMNPPELRELVRRDPDLVFHPTVASLGRWTTERAT